MKKFDKIVFILTTAVICSSCGQPNKVDLTFEYENVEIKYNNPTLVELEKPTNINSRDELTNFFDYSIFYGKPDEIMYTNVTDSYKEVLLKNFEEEVTWAGQYGALAHNFLQAFDDSKIDENLIGGYGYFTPYAEKKNSRLDYDFEVYDYTYYDQVLSKDNNRNYALGDFDLYKNNNGFIKVENSEQLFYAAANDYMPFIENNEHLETLLGKTLGILNRILTPNMSDIDKYEAIYTYMTNNVFYDYEMLNNKGGDPHLYDAYYLEGAILDDLAVCDGLTKAVVLMCAFEGIESVHIGALSYHGGHAYNYTNIDDNYYLSCVTNGSKISNYKTNKFLNHTKLYYLSDYQPAPDREFASEARQDLINKVKNVEKYDFWSNKKIKLDDKEYSLHIVNKEDGLELLSKIDELAYEKGINLDIELLIDYDLGQQIIREVNFKCENTLINNGLFNGSKLYDFVFLGGAK